MESRGPENRCRYFRCRMVLCQEPSPGERCTRGADPEQTRVVLLLRLGPQPSAIGSAWHEKTAAEMLDATIDWEALKKANDDREKLKWELIGDETSFMSLGAHLVEYDDSAWKTVSLPNKEPIMDFVWVRKHVNLKSAKGVRFYMGEITQLCSVFMNGQLVSKESWQDSTGIVEISPDIARKGDNVIAIRASNSWDNRVWIGRSGEMWLEASGKKQSLEGDWKYSNTLEPAMPKVERFNWKPGVLYNGMIQPIAGYGIRGAIWYQGKATLINPTFTMSSLRR